jgi:MFS family permease
LQFLSPAVTGFATFSLIGFYSALIPSLIRESLIRESLIGESLLGESLHQSALLIAGGVVCELFLVAAVVILASGKFASQTATLTALILLPPSVWILVGAELAHSLPLLVFAAALGGLAGGLGYRGSLEVINRIAPADRRSEVVSSYMIALFAGNSLPVIGVGFLSAAMTSLTAHVIFAAVLTALAGIALLTGIKFAPNK